MFASSVTAAGAIAVPWTSAALIVRVGAVFTNVVSVLASATGSVAVYATAGRALEILLERLERRAFQRALRDRILDDLVARFRGTQLTPQLGHLRHVQPFEVDKDRTVGSFEGRFELLEFGLFLCSRAQPFVRVLIRSSTVQAHVPIECSPALQGCRRRWQA